MGYLMIVLLLAFVTAGLVTATWVLIEAGHFFWAAFVGLFAFVAFLFFIAGVIWALEEWSFVLDKKG